MCLFFCITDRWEEGLPVIYKKLCFNKLKQSLVEFIFIHIVYERLVVYIRNIYIDWK